MAMQVSEDDFYKAIDYLKSKPSLSDNLIKVVGQKTPCYVSVMRSGKLLYYVADEVGYVLGLQAKEVLKTQAPRKLPTQEPQHRKAEADKLFKAEMLKQRKQLGRLADLFEEEL
jgi:hypothetical protein